MDEIPNFQRDIRWLFANAKAAGLAAPCSEQAQAFAERGAIKMADAGQSESEARRDAFDEMKGQLAHTRVTQGHESHSPSAETRTQAQA